MESTKVNLCWCSNGGVGWWTGYKLGGVVALTSAEFFQKFGIENYWQMTFLVLGVVIIACNIGLMFINEALQTDRNESQNITDKMIQDKLGSPNLLTKTISWLTGTVIGPIISFFKKNGFKISLAILAFIFLFKIGEAFLGRMSVIFYKEIGFTKSDIALYSKGFGWLTMVIFTLLGGLLPLDLELLKLCLSQEFNGFDKFSLLAWSGKSNCYSLLQ